MRVCLLVLVGACRLGFDEVPSPDAASSNLPDAPGDVGDGDLAFPAITFGERPTSDRTGVTSDATLDQSNPVANWGAAEDLSLAAFGTYREHGLLRFDLSSLAAGTPVGGARLALTKVDYGDETPGPLEVRLVAESWVEGTSNGVPGSGASWSGRDGTTMWSTAGGTTTQTIATVTPETAAFVVLIPREVVQGWIDAPATNHGVLLAAAASGAHFHVHARDSKLDGMTARPELAIILVQ